MSADSEISSMGSLLAISPHCDDAVLGCGEQLAMHPGAVVVTVFAGRPAAYEPFTEWDRACGFEPGDDVMHARLDEDRQALEVLGAMPVWLDFLDSQYGCSPTASAIAARLEQALDELAPRHVLLPMGLFHSDHLLAHAAARRLIEQHPELRWTVYEDALYRRIDGALAERLAELRSSGFELRRCEFDASPQASERKARAIACYRSQLKALATPGRLGHLDAFTPEGYWDLHFNQGSI